MEGVNTFNHETTTHTHAATSSFTSSLEQWLNHYFDKLEGSEPANLYRMVREQMERPLLKSIMMFTGGNQSKAAKMLGLSRGTLRKKLAEHNVETD